MKEQIASFNDYFVEKIGTDQFLKESNQTNFLR